MSENRAVNLGALDVIPGHAPACRCGAAMKATQASHAARERIVYYRCRACGCTGYVNETAAPAP